MPPSVRSRSAVITVLRNAGCVFAEEEADLILASADTPTEIDAMVARRAAGYPLEQVLGWASFCGLRILIDPGVFVPRPRTEFLAHQAIEIARRAPGATVVDLCCGTGALGLAIAASLKDIDLYAADVDPAAVGCARRNIGTAGKVFQGDLFDALPANLVGRIDVLVANAPYVPTGEIGMMPREARMYEARVALDGGPDGLDVVRRLAGSAGHWLAPGGHLLVEVSEGQAAATTENFSAGGLLPRVSASEELDAVVLIGRLPGSHANG